MKIKKKYNIKQFQIKILFNYKYKYKFLYLKIIKKIKRISIFINLKIFKFLIIFQNKFYQVMPIKNPCNTNYYISEKGYEGVRNFKYKGGSSSILYGNLWSPLCNWIVEKLIPSTLAPNTITAFASIQFIITHLAIMYYSPDFQSEIPVGLIVWAGFSVLFYQILDNCDGKQARATGSSSPLGMLFDHGCDSCITWVMSLTVCNVIGLGQNALSYFSSIFISQIAFYMAQWSQFHVGVFKLGYINAVDEGLVLVESLFFITAALGQQFWLQKVDFLWDLQMNQIMIYGTLAGAIIQILIFIYDTISEVSAQSVLRSLTCVLWLIGVYSLVYYFAPEGFIEQYGLYVIYAFAALFSKVTLQVQLAHLTQEDFKQMTFSYVFISLFMVVSFGINKMVKDVNLLQAEIILYVTIFMAIVSYLHMAVCVSVQIARILGIRVFSIKKAQTFLPFSNELSNINKQTAI